MSDLISILVNNLPHYNHAKLLTVEDDEFKENIIPHNKLSEKNLEGTVISTFRDEDGELNYVVDKTGHTLVLGTTGSGKSTGQFSAQVIFTAFSKKCSVIIVDSKGAMYELYSELFRQNGYNVKVLNLKKAKLKNTEAFNPFYPVAKVYFESMSGIGADVKKVYNEGKTIFEYKGERFGSKEELAIKFKRERDEILTDMFSQVKKIFEQLFPVESKKEPQWEHEAVKLGETLAAAMILDLFSINETQRTSLSQINLANFKALFESFTAERKYGHGELGDYGYLSQRGENSVIFKKVKHAFFGDAESTFRNHLMFVEHMFNKFSRGLMELMRVSTFSANDLVDELTAYFICVDEMDPLSRPVLNFHLSDILGALKTIADESPNLELKRPVLVMIDEFGGSLPKNPDIPNFVAFSRSRKIYLSMVIQSYSQLISKYGDEEAKTILDNVSHIIYCGSADFNTVKKFSDECGKVTVASPTDILMGAEDIRIEERPLVPESDLAVYTQGNVYVKRAGKNTLKGCFQKSYEVLEYRCPRVKLSDYISGANKLYEESLYDIEKIKKARLDLDDDDDDDLF